VRTPRSVAGVDRAAVEPGRYLVHPEDTQTLQSQVSLVGRENAVDWIGDINPRYQSGLPQFQNNCGDCSRAFAITSQTDNAVAAAGDSRLGELPEMWEWTDSRPTNTIGETDPAKLPDFQRVAWGHIAQQLQDQPAGTVAVVGVDWADVRIGDRVFAQGGHWFNAHVTNDGLKFADAQTGKYTDWPPQFGRQIRQIESVYRNPGQPEWRT
jgi:Papain fold toxin 1, glutamine deamidase